MITRIILQKHKYDIQIFPNYSWMTVLFEKILIVKDIMKYFLSKWFSLKRSFERYFYLLSTLIFVIPYWTYWSLVILLTGHMRTRSYENTPFFWLKMKKSNMKMPFILLIWDLWMLQYSSKGTNHTGILLLYFFESFP